jgi:murein L,D-transpeptidase YcbB/YkuD
MKRSAARTTAIAGIGVVVASSLALTLSANGAPAQYPTTSTMVAEGVSEHIAAEEARIAAEEARLAEEARQAEAARQAEQARAAAAAPAPSSPTNDYGIADSAYTGAYYNPAYESTRKCIVKKESGGNYGIVSSNGLYHGAYQFSRPTGDATAQKMGRPDLVGTPVSSWSRYDQDQAFWTLWNNGAGRGNWPTAAGC